jgi:hypothetical protein
MIGAISVAGGVKEDLVLFLDEGLRPLPSVAYPDSHLIRKGAILSLERSVVLMSETDEPGRATYDSGFLGNVPGKVGQRRWLIPSAHCEWIEGTLRQMRVRRYNNRWIAQRAKQNDRSEV